MLHYFSTLLRSKMYLLKESHLQVQHELRSMTCFKLMKGKALRKHSLHEKTAASVLLKLFISGNE